jgi:hypothetical protein
MEAQFNLGALYMNGQGVAQDYRESARWYKLAAEQGQAEAEYNLGVLYANGQGVSRDNSEAAHWYRLAAEQGHADAGFNLGALYTNGVGVTKDLVEGYRWFTIAASQGDQDSVKAKERVAARLSPEELQRSRALAAAWTPCKSKVECDARAAR